MDGPGGLNWTVETTEGGRSKRTKSGRYAKVDGPAIQKWTIQRENTKRYEIMNLDGLK